MMVLSDDKERQGLTTAQIITSIQYDLKIGQFPEVSISDSLSRLQKAGFVNGVHSRGKEIYILSEDKLDVINLMAKEYSKTLMGVKKEIAKRMGDVLDAPVDLELENSVFSSFQKVLPSVLSNEGEKCCYSIIGTHGTDSGVLKSDNILRW